MEFVNFKYCDGWYSYNDASMVGICILGRFLTGDVRNGAAGWKEWVLDKTMDFTSSNATCLEKKGNSIRLFDGTERISKKSRANGITVSLDQLVQLLNDWEEKVWKKKPKEVMIKHESGQFIIGSVEFLKKT